MKSVLLSIHQQYCDNIISFKKLWEIRKTKPNLKPPFVVYIYETKKINKNKIVVDLDGNLPTVYARGQGKVIGKFICDKIVPIFAVAHEPWKYLAGDAHDKEKRIVSEACLSEQDIHRYSKGKDLYAWHISNLKIYDKPKELSEFSKYWDSENDIRPCQKGQQCEFKYYDFSEFCEACFIDFDGADCPKVKLKRPPQSWCYVNS